MGSMLVIMYNYKVTNTVPHAEMYCKGKCVLRFGQPLHTSCARQFTHIYIAFMVFYPARFVYNLMSVFFMPFLALMSLSLYFSFL